MVLSPLFFLISISTALAESRKVSTAIPPIPDTLGKWSEWGLLQEGNGIEIKFRIRKVIADIGPAGKTCYESQIVFENRGNKTFSEYSNVIDYEHNGGGQRRSLVRLGIVIGPGEKIYAVHRYLIFKPDRVTSWSY